MKWFYRGMLLSGMLLGAYSYAMAQTDSLHIQGTVSEISGKGRRQPLAGATVFVPGTATGTQTDAAGAFSLTIPGSVATLVASFAGYNSDTVEVTGDTRDLAIIMNQPRKLKEVVVSGKAKGTTIDMLNPAKVELIGQAELFKAACCNLSESFETTPSIDVSFTDAVSGYKQIMMLGLAGPYTLVTRENIPDIRGLAAVTGLTYIPGYWIENMQLSKGTGSVVNGFESVAGQLNVELRKPYKDEKLLLNMYENSQGRTELNFIVRHELSKRLSTNTFINISDKWLKTDQNKDGFLDQPLGPSIAALNRWVYHAPRGYELQWGLKGVYVSNTGGQWNYEKGMAQVPGNAWGYKQDTRRLEAWAKIGKIFYDHPGRSVGLQLSGTYHNQDASYGARAYSGIQKSFYANLIYQDIISNTNHQIKGGLSSMVDNIDETFQQQQYGRNEVVPGAFVEYSYNYLNKFNLVAGLRGDYDNLYGGFVTPRLHLRYAPFKKTIIRASVGRAERTANIFAENIGYMASSRTFAIAAANSGTKPYGLDPEIAWNSGINLTQKFTLNYKDGTIGVDYYYTNFQNQVVVDVEDPHFVRFYNLNGTSFANSLQVQLDYELIHNLDVRLAYRL
ncbi:MAG: TonB-dependent receptor, partial [Flavipsychrobacter sp.]